MARHSMDVDENYPKWPDHKDGSMFTESTADETFHFTYTYLIRWPAEETLVGLTNVSLNPCFSNCD